ncbi:hypothetical protein [Chromobacterium haemolyticum]|uniref:hypothetical protein n=1 Tax=Chromobacterium haemolyticum TaxID=394935 RepID=UPI0024473F5B|nr:hypothetical protein [Chromobacterium haemolyticum]MDH0342055.1 hypothetical protein [Chromobacterium haemolyticum]
MTLLTEWPYSNPTACTKMEQIFARLGVPVEPGMHDHPAFLAAERVNPRLLESLARYVESRSYSAEYLAEARHKIQVVADAVYQSVRQDGRLGACVDASGMIGRMLDTLGVWNYVAKASLTVDYPRRSGLPSTFYWAIDEGAFVAPHAIVVAPPYAVIDVTVSLQPYDLGQGEYLPERVLADDIKPAQWNINDLVSPLGQQLARRGRMAAINLVEPQMLEVMKWLPPRSVHHAETSLKYIPLAVGGFIEPLSEITGYRPSGRTAQQIFDQDVVPNLADHQP